MDGGKATGTVSIDLSKAFDTINYSVLLEKLSRYGIQEKELNWFTDYLLSNCTSQSTNNASLRVAGKQVVSPQVRFAPGRFAPSQSRFAPT